VQENKGLMFKKIAFMIYETTKNRKNKGGTVKSFPFPTPLEDFYSYTKNG
jgi:hypothetical protein